MVKFCTGASRLHSEIDNDPAQSQVPFIRNSSGESGHAVYGGLTGPQGGFVRFAFKHFKMKFFQLECRCLKTQ